MELDLDSEDIEDIIEIDDENIVELRVPKRYIRDGNNPLEMCSDMEFNKRFRLCKESVLHGILPKIEMGLVKINNRGLPIPPVLQLLIRLRFYASASFQVVIGDTISVSQATISRIIFRVSSLIVRLISQIIKMPVTQERKTENYELFKRLGYYNGAIRLPGVDGAIDCTHIRLTHTISKH